MSQYVPMIGAICFGIVIGWLVRYFIRRFDSFGAASLSSVVSIVGGGAAVEFVKNEKNLLWFYAIGLFLGFVIYQIIVLWILGGRGGSGGNGPKVPIDVDKKSEPRFILRR